VPVIIEASRYSLRYDKEIKAPLYATHGIQKYWIIDLDNSHIEIYRNPKGEVYIDTNLQNGR